LDFPPERFSKGGSVCVETTAKINRTYPIKAEVAKARVLEGVFRAKGFTIAELPPGSDYGFLFVSAITAGSASSSTVIGDTAFINHNNVHKVSGEFYSLRANGTPDRLLWSEHTHDCSLAGRLGRR
jgi:hypothetical protein